MTQETPAKVFSLLGAAMFSMFFLFAVSATNASFTRTESALPNIMAPENVVAALDSIANSYSNFLEANLIQPAEQTFAFVQDNVNYIMDEAGPSILTYTGLSSLAEAVTSSAQPQVAGAFTEHHIPGVNIDVLYAFLMR